MENPENLQFNLLNKNLRINLGCLALPLTRPIWRLVFISLFNVGPKVRRSSKNNFLFFKFILFSKNKQVAHYILFLNMNNNLHKQTTKEFSFTNLLRLILHPLYYFIGHHSVVSMPVSDHFSFSLWIMLNYFYELFTIIMVVIVCG